MKKIAFIVLLLVFILIFVSISKVTNVKYKQYSEDQGFIWMPLSGNEVFEFDREKYDGIDIGYVVKTYDDAERVFEEYIYKQVPYYIRIINNICHIKYDSSNERFILYYGGVENMHGYYAVIYTDNNSLYFIRIKL